MMVVFIDILQKGLTKQTTQVEKEIRTLISISKICQLFYFVKEKSLDSM